MIYEYAVDPGLFADFGIFRLFYDSFGKEKGRLISDIPSKEWTSLARTILKEKCKKPRERTKISAGLIALKKRGVLYQRCACQWDEEKPWITNAEINHHSNAFHAIISHDGGGGECPVLTPDWSISDQELWKAPNDQTVERTAAVMVETIRPMLDCAKEVVLVDRNFDPNKLRFRRVMLEIVARATQETQQPGLERIAYHLGDEREIEGGCIDRIKPSLPAGVSIDFYIWSKDDLHARFVLTDIGGVLVEHGLDDYDGPGTQDVLISRLSEDTYKKWWTLCHARAPDFSISADP